MIEREARHVSVDKAQSADTNDRSRRRCQYSIPSHSSLGTVNHTISHLKLIIIIFKVTFIQEVCGFDGPWVEDPA